MLRTPRVLLRPWRDEDRAPFAALNEDPEVMAYLPGPLTPADSDGMRERIATHLATHGFTFWALEIVDPARPIPFAGFVGLARPRFEAAFTPCVEIGWRLARAAWGHGYATEAAREALRFGFEERKLPEIVSYTVPDNVRSWRVMERLGMTRSPADDFEHPQLAPGHRLRRHVLYRLDRARWEAARR